jgi:hypothetical protein
MPNKYVEICHIYTDDGQTVSPDVQTRGIQLSGLNGLATTQSLNTANLIINEGVSFPVTISGSTRAGHGTYSAQNGYYTVLGNIIFITGHVSWSTHTGTGNLLLSGMPFVANASANINPEITTIFINIFTPPQMVQLWSEMQPNTSYASINWVDKHGSVSAIGMATSGEIHFTGWYYN